jgi:hypothetical protein
MNDFITLIVCGTILFFSMIAGITIYNLEENNLKSKNIETAISKGIDPLSVRCSYASSQDMVCVAYAASRK